MIFLDQVFYKPSQQMSEVPDNTIDLIVTSPPYFNIKDYSKDGYQDDFHSIKKTEDIGGMESYEYYLAELLKVWSECERVLKPNGKLVINSPLMPMKKREYNTHYNRHIFDINADIQHGILHNTSLFLMDVYIWNRTNPSKKLMFGSYPYPRNFYAQNTVEFVTVYVKDGKPDYSYLTNETKQNSLLTEKEWTEYTKQIWDIPIPNKNDSAFGKHSAIMPEEIIYRCVRLFTFEGDVVLDPFTGSGTTLKVAKSLNRHYVGYELYENYKHIIEVKLSNNSLFINENK